MTNLEPQLASTGVIHRSPWGVRRIAIVAATLLLAAWLLSPMFTSTYVEAYMERLQTMAMLQPHGRLWLDDQAYPINTEFLYVTRLGMVELMRGCIAIFGASSLWGLRALTIGSFAVVTAACLAFSRRWAASETHQATPWWPFAVFLVLVPGIVEPSFFFADNLISAAFATAALALVTGKVSVPRWLIIGGLFGAAMLVRLDALLIAPLILSVLWLACRDYRRIAVAVLLGAVGASAVFLLNWRFTGISLLQAIQVGRFFSAVNANGVYSSGFKRTVIIALGFFGFLSLPFLAAGVWSNLKLRAARWSLVMTLVPTIFYLVVLPKANEIRDFCLLGAPYVVLHGGTGLRLLVDSALGKRRLPVPLPTWAARLALLACACVFLSPPVLLRKDGPRPIAGRIWSPIFWRQWQDIRFDAVSRLHGLVDSVRPGERFLIINSHYEPDRTLHLLLLQAGYQLQPARQDGDCQSLETLTNGPTSFTLLRTESPYGMIASGKLDKEVSALQVTSSFSCLQGQSFDHQYYLLWGGDSALPEQTVSEVRIPEPSFRFKVLHGAKFPSLRVIPLDPDAVVRLKAAAAQLERHPLEAGSYQLPSYQEFRQQMRDRYWTPEH